MIGSLLYLTSSRPNIMFSVYLCARFQSNPRETHMTTVKFIFRYLIGTTTLSLFFKGRENFRLQGYYDADYVGHRIEKKKNTSGGCHFIAGNLFSWMSKNQLEDYDIYESKIHIFL